MSELGETTGNYWFEFCTLLARRLYLQASTLCQIVRMDSVKEKEMKLV